MQKEFTLTWKQAAKIFDNYNYQKVVTSEGNTLTLKKLKDIEKWTKNMLSPIYENNGTMIFHCQDNNKQYQTRYMEYGDIREDTQLYIGDYYFTIIT